MDLDKLKNTAKQVRAPEVDGGTGGPANTDRLLEVIKATDEREYRQMRKALPFYLVAAAIFGVAGLAALAGASPGRTAHLGVLATVFLLLSIVMFARLRSMRRLDYAVPVRLFLAQTESRYRLMRPIDLWYSIPLLLALAASGGFVTVKSLIPRYVAGSHLSAILTVYSLFFAGVCSMGIYFTYKNWKRDKARIYEDVRRIRRELESE